MAVVAEKKTMEKADLLKMQAVINDPEAKHMGPAKAGGQWFKNYGTGTLYRVDKALKDCDVYSIMEKKENTVQAKKAGAAKPAADTASLSRKEMMEEARTRKIKYFRIMSKSELEQVLASSTAPEQIKTITDDAIKRWKK